MLIPLCGCIHGLVKNFWQADCWRHKPVSHCIPKGREDPSLFSQIAAMKNILANLFVNPDISDILELWFFGKLWKDSRHVSVPVALERRENTQEGDRDLFDLIENGAKTNSTSKTIKTKKWLKAKTNSLSKAIKNQKTLKKVTKICSIWLKAKTNSPARTSRLVRFE